MTKAPTLYDSAIYYHKTIYKYIDYYYYITDDAIIYYA